MARFNLDQFSAISKTAYIIRQLWKDGDITATNFANLARISRPTLYSYIQEQEGMQLLLKEQSNIK